MILIGLFAIQKKGAGFIGNMFGPVMLAWFLVIACSASTASSNHPACSRQLARSMRSIF